MAKTINDPVHGHIQLSGEAMSVIDTPHFQRLRDLKQLGSTYLLFPGASHNRFEHSLGVSHLAHSMLHGLKQRQPDLEINDRDLRVVSLAGLCHDLGHGPFSHAFEGWVGRFKPDWHHENMSLLMLEELVDANGVDIEQEDIRSVQDLISGKPSRSSGDKLFLFDIVANQRNSIDVDKFDYISRDCLNVGIKSSYDHSRLMMHCKVINDQICWHRKEVFNIYEMFHTRYSLFKQVYTHRVGKAIEYMIQDALSLANEHLNIIDCVDKAADFYTLTDNILLQIQYSKSHKLAAAREVVHRLRRRNLYRLADTYLIPRHVRQNFTDITEMDIVANQNDGDGLEENDVILNRMSLNYGMRNLNPMDYTNFYSDARDTECFTIPKTHVSLLIPNEFEETYIRVYTRSPEKEGATRRAFRNLLRRRGVYEESPSKKTSKRADSLE